MPVGEPRPFMGSVEISLADPDAESKLAIIRERIGSVGLQATELPYPGRVMVFYGLEHTSEYRQGEIPPVQRLDFDERV